jgi:hypothetical protein
VRYNGITPAGYSAFDFPGADELANMFQFQHRGSRAYCARRNLTTSHRLNPNLTSSERWLDQNVPSIPVG